MQMQLTPTQDAQIAQAAAIQHMDLDQLVIGAALREADAIIARGGRVSISARDFTRIPELLENPPAPNKRLKAAIGALPDAL
jgi:uncharacterized protein (DUF1778 family)